MHASAHSSEPDEKFIYPLILHPRKVIGKYAKEIPEGGGRGEKKEFEF